MIISLPAQQGAVTEDTIKPHGLFNPAQTNPDATSGKKLELAIKVVELIDDVVKLSALKRRQLSRD
ncbi:hypothetical protein [Corynebacterium accolens]|uniref:hypothetical protein n=1 Tax=Corynebacterium accolens TaxID=38284 RepID=UPI00254EEF29|nr:hypothetical protein [Corynebacterium accolens]MDK8678748.1 hypothetical protein [Corynebacterium accolens]